MASLVDIMAVVSRQLTASIEASRTVFEHRLTKGEAVEEAVKSFLRSHLPSSIGIAHGQVIDRHGAISRQLDIILYDSNRTPILFSDESQGNRIVPVEGVIAAIEVKTALETGDISALAESAKKLKSLDCSAYYQSQDSAVVNVQFAYGREWPALPPLYFIMAFDGPKASNTVKYIEAAHVGTPLHQRIDMVCILRNGVVYNSSPDGSGIEAISSPGSVLSSIETGDALLLFYILMTRYVLQAKRPPISIQSYLPSEFKF